MRDKFNVEAQNLPEPGEEEIWLPAPHYEDRYEISNFGQLRNRKTKRLRKICYDNGGYPVVSLKIDNIVHCVYIHRMVCEAFNGPPTAENNVCDHIDRCIVNNYYKNLHWTDHQGNRLNSQPTQKKYISKTKTPIVFLDNWGKFIQRFNNMVEASETLHISVQQIQQNIRGRRKPFRNGCYFRVEADYLTSFDREKIF